MECTTVHLSHGLVCVLYNSMILLGGRSYLIVEGYSTAVEIITQAEGWLLLGRTAHTALPIP